MNNSKADPSVSAALDELRSRQEITDLLYAYAWHFDRNEPQELGELFTGSARVDYGPEVAPLSGRTDIVNQVRSGLETIFAATSHHISNVRIEFQSDASATATCYVYAWHRYRDGSPDGDLWGQYHVRLERGRGAWLIAALELRAAGTKDFHRSAMHPIGRREAG